MYCNKCGKEIPDESKFCSYCGSIIKNEEKNFQDKENIRNMKEQGDNKKEEEKHEKVLKLSLKKLITIILIIVVIFIGTLIIIMNKKKSNNINLLKDNNIKRSETVNLFKIEAENNKRQNVNLNVNEENFSKQIETDLSKFKETINGYYINVEGFEAFGLYNSTSNEFEFINYYLKCRDSYNPEGLYYYVFSCYDTLIPYGIGNDQNLSRVVDDDTMAVIYNAMNDATNYNYKNEYYAITISEEINADLYKKLYNMANFTKYNLEISIINLNSKTRPYAVVIDNNPNSWPQCGLDKAYIVYEMIVEGGMTRLLALYKDYYPSKIGAVRALRHYMIDYVEENDAIQIHWGGSPDAYNRINSNRIHDLDGIALEGDIFYRDNNLNREQEHTGFVNLEKAKEYAESQRYTRDTTKKSLLKYSSKEIDLSTKEKAKIANNIELKYSNNYTTSYIYDKENKVYKKSMNGTQSIDLITGKPFTVKNIIIYTVNNYDLDEQGRQELENIGSGTGYYITNGYAIPITWNKTSHSEQTEYIDESGAQILVNDGNTFIQICPNDGRIVIE